MNTTKFMPRRFSDIYRGGELKYALDNLNKYRSEMESRESPRMTGTGTPKSRLQEIVKIAPFYMEPLGGSGATLKIVQVRQLKGVMANADNFASAVLNNYQVAGETEANTPRPDGFSPARARVFHPTEATGVYKQSKYTKLHYASIPGKNFNVPFGQTATYKSYETAIAKIANDLATAINGTAYRRLSFQEELIPGK